MQSNIYKNRMTICKKAVLITVIYDDLFLTG